MRELLNEIIRAEHFDDHVLIEICVNLGWTDQQILDVCKHELEFNEVDRDYIKYIRNQIEYKNLAN